MEVSPSRCSIASCKNSDSELSPIRSDKHRPSSIKISEADSPVKTAISNVDDEDTPLTINDCGSDQLIQPISNEKLITKNEPFMPEYVDNTERVESVIPKLSKR
jgi:hypothetical protein